MGAIFISYRREDTEGQAGRLFEDLSREFGRGAVFMDVAAIEPGRDFRRVIDQQVASCGVLLALIGRKWVDAVDETGARRLDDPNDFVRLETASALRRDIPVVPVLVHGAKMPRSEELPEELKEFAFRNAVELTHARWESDVQVLVRALRPYAQPVATPAAAPPVAPVPTPQVAQGGKGKFAAVAGGIAVAGIAAAWMFAGTSKQGTPPAAEGSVVIAGAALPASASPPPTAASAVVKDPQKTKPPPNDGAGTQKPGGNTSATIKKQPPIDPPVIDTPPTTNPRVSLVGNWKAQACTFIVETDDGKTVSGGCNTGMAHNYTGRYVSKDTIDVTISRIDTKQPCTTTAKGTIKILGPDIIEISQEGWDGCGVKTGPATTLLKRS